jgi:hypothetical protein
METARATGVVWDLDARRATPPNLEDLHSARKDAERFEGRAARSQGLKRWWYERLAGMLRWIDG